jgi:DNA-binding Lrp family transcriptional regulator
MKELKALDRKLLWELVKNSRRSDRQLAKAIGTSQPTVTRRRAFLEKEMIDAYTAIPKWRSLGYELFALTFVKIKPHLASRKMYDEVRKRGLEWLMSQPQIIMGGGCRGMGVDSFMMSLHKSYTDYDEFMRNCRLELGEYVDDLQTVFINVDGKELLKPFYLKYLAEAK